MIRCHAMHVQTQRAGGWRQHVAPSPCEAALTRVLTTSLAPTISVLVMNRLLAKNRYRNTCRQCPDICPLVLTPHRAQHADLAWPAWLSYCNSALLTGHQGRYMAGKRWPTQWALLPQRTLTTSRIVWAFGARRLIYRASVLSTVSKESSVFVISHGRSVQALSTQAHRPG